MKTNIFLFTALAAVSFISCSKDLEVESVNEGVPMTFVVSHESAVDSTAASDPTKASLVGNLVSWDKNDQIAILTQKAAATSGDTWTNVSRITTSGTGASASFSGTVTQPTSGLTWSDYYFAVYPTFGTGKSSYLRYNEKDGSTVKLSLFYVPMGTTQYGRAGKFSTIASPTSTINGLVSAAMYGFCTANPTSSEQNLKMKNAYAIIKFVIAGEDVTQVDFKIGTGEICAERAAIKPTEAPFGWSKYDISPWSGQGNSTTLRVIPESGKDTFEPGTYYVSCRPVSGIPTIYIHKNGQVGKLSGKSSVTLTRSHITQIGPSDGLDTKISEYNTLSDITVTYDFASNTVWKQGEAALPTTTTQTTKDFVAYQDNNGRTVSIKAMDGYRYDETNKALYIKYGSSCPVIKMPQIEGLRIAKYKVTFAQSNAANFSLGSNDGNATVYSTPITTSSGTHIAQRECLYTTPTSNWYLKPSKASELYITKIEVTYSQQNKL